MEKQKNILSMLLLFILIVSIAIPSFIVQAQTTRPTAGPLPSGVTPFITVKTTPYLSFAPNPIGVGQTLLVNIWMKPPIIVARQFFGAFVVTFTMPDGTEDVIGPMDSYEGDASTWFEYVPNKVGNWTVKLDFLGMYFPAGRYLRGDIVSTGGTSLESAYYEPSSTQEVPFVVQESPILSWPPSPLPTDYWTRPVSPEHREWWPILGNYPPDGTVGGDTNWPADTNKYMSNYEFVPYTRAPDSAHIVWKRQGELGGLIGGAMGQISQTEIQAGVPSIIYAGRGYQTISKPGSGVSAQNYWQCYDIRTGEIYWERPLEPGETAPNLLTYTKRTTQAVEGEAAHMRGLGVRFMSLSGGRLLKYDPWTGECVSNISIAPLTTGTLFADPFVRSVQNLGGGRYSLVTWTTDDGGAFGMTGSQIANLTNRIVSNITWPINTLGYADYEANVTVVTQGISNPGTGVTIGNRLIGVSLTTGSVLWNVTTDLSSGGLDILFSGNTGVSDHGKFAVRMNNGEIKAWNLHDGSLAWTSKLTSWPWGAFGAYDVQSAYGLIFSNAYDGVHAINWTNGNVEWSFHSPNNPYETPYQGQNPWHSAGKVADGKLFTYTDEHTPSQPYTRGWRFYCLNATTGEEIWSFSGTIEDSRVFQGAVADGYLTMDNRYDAYMYVFGKGKSATTVQAPLTAITLGQSLMLTGTVMDLSPAQPGTPCVSKESMSAWMEYIHMQKAMPTDVTGVPVSLDIIDPNGNHYNIGTVTTDNSGTFKKLWQPEVPGEYVITATFAGSESYGSSWAEAVVGVVDAEQTSSPDQPTIALPPTEAYFAISTAVIVAVIAVVGVVIALMLKKKP